MKRFLALLLAIILCFGMVGCGKSEAVKAAEAAITALASAEDMAEALTLAQVAYDAVPVEERSKVKNATDLTAAWNAFFVGEWVRELTHSYYNEIVLSMREDGTMSISGFFGENGTWSYEDGEIIWNGDVNDKSKVYMEDGIYKIILDDYDEAFVRKEDFEASFAQKYIAVEITPENFDDYIGQPKKMAYSVVNEWGDEVPYSDAWICESNAYDKGLVFMRSVDFMYERKMISGENWTEAYPFDPMHFGRNDKVVSAGERAKGTLYFVREEYVDEIYLDEKSERYVKLTNGTSVFISSAWGWDKIATPEQAIQEYPF